MGKINSYMVSRETSQDEVLTISGPTMDVTYRVTYRWRAEPEIVGESSATIYGSSIPTKGCKRMVEAQAKEDLLSKSRRYLRSLSRLLEENDEAERREEWE